MNNRNERKDTKENPPIKKPSHNIFDGMSINIQSRDQETGWCYKNGGRPAYGYQIIHLNRGTNSKGKPIIKSIWGLHPENAKLARMIIIELYLHREMSYKDICEYLNGKNIAGPANKPWRIPTIVEMLRETRLEQYAGMAFWNKETRHSPGRFNPQNEWIKVVDAHPAIISLQELDVVLDRKKRAQNKAGTGKTIKSPYLFTGTNLEEQPMFVCAQCGGNIIGYRSSSRNWTKYICGPSRYKGEALCPNRFMVDQNWLEDTIVELIDKKYPAPYSLNEIVHQVQNDINAVYKGYHDILNNLSRVKNQLENEAQELTDADLLMKINKLESKIRSLKNNPPRALPTGKNNILQFSASFSATFYKADISHRKQLVRYFVRDLEMDPVNKEIRVTLYPDNIVHSICVD
ncbi:MAG: recombinase family protein [Syntrophomonas sp.]|nr:recombinase family protein [Syntrophomonas sp.]